MSNLLCTILAALAGGIFTIVALALVGDIHLDLCLDIWTAHDDDDDEPPGAPVCGQA